MKKVLILLSACVLSIFPLLEIASVSEVVSLGNPKLSAIREGKYYLHFPLFLTDRTTSFQVRVTAAEPAQASATVQEKTLTIILTGLADLEIEISGESFALNRLFLKREIEGLAKQWTANVLWGKYLSAKKAQKDPQLLQTLFRNAYVAYQELSPYQPGYAKGALQVLEREEQYFLKGLLAEENSPLPHQVLAKTSLPSESSPVPNTTKIAQPSRPVNIPVATPDQNRALVSSADQAPQNLLGEEITVLPLPKAQLTTQGFSGNLISAGFDSQHSSLKATFLDQIKPRKLWERLVQSPLLAFPVTLFLVSLIEGVLVVCLILSLLYLLFSDISRSEEDTSPSDLPAKAIGRGKPPSRIPRRIREAKTIRRIPQQILVQEKSLYESSLSRH